MSLFSRLSLLSRRKKLGLFYSLMTPCSGDKVLDIGGEINPHGDRGLQLIDSYKWKDNLYAINVDEQYVTEIVRHYPDVTAQVASACEIPWPDKYFDIAYCNAVIEHVGNFEAQKKMAQEVMRVSKRWFVTTPNRWFPYEFHMRLPLVTWLPGDLYIKTSKLIRYDHSVRKYVFGRTYSGLRLLTHRELRSCFPDSQILKSRVTFMAETMLVFGGIMSPQVT